MHTMLMSPLPASVIHGTATLVLWMIGIIRIVVGAVALFRHVCFWGSR